MTVIRDPAKLEDRRGTIYPSESAKGFEGCFRFLHTSGEPYP